MAKKKMPMKKPAGMPPAGMGPDMMGGVGGMMGGKAAAPFPKAGPKSKAKKRGK